MFLHVLIEITDIRFYFIASNNRYLVTFGLHDDE